MDSLFIFALDFPEVNIWWPFLCKTCIWCGWLVQKHCSIFDVRIRLPVFQMPHLHRIIQVRWCVKCQNNISHWQATRSPRFSQYHSIDPPPPCPIPYTFQHLHHYLQSTLISTGIFTFTARSFEKTVATLVIQFFFSRRYNKYWYSGVFLLPDQLCGPPPLIMWTHPVCLTTCASLETPLFVLWIIPRSTTMDS